MNAGRGDALQFFAICPRGFESLLGEELAALGAQGVRAESGGVSFRGPLAAGYAANLHSRLASRILWQLARAPYRSESDLYDAASAVAWEAHLDARLTLRLDISAAGSPLRSLEFAMLRVKDAVVDRLRARTGARPSIDRQRPDARVFVFLDATQVALYLDFSGEALFKRGWRADKGEAPLKENLAAGLLGLAGWNPARPLLDPFCGSGTLVIEAACIASKRAPGLMRRFGFERLLSHDRALWHELRGTAQAQVDDRAPALIVGSDISTRVIEQARTNAGQAGVSTWLRDGRLVLRAGDARAMQPPAAAGMLITNPPYGEQSAPRSASVPALMGDLGDALKQRFAGWEAWMLTSDRALPRQMRLRETRKTVVFNGPIECRFFRFQVVEGSYRRRAGSDRLGTPQG